MQQDNCQIETQIASSWQSGIKISQCSFSILTLEKNTEAFVGFKSEQSWVTVSQTSSKISTVSKTGKLDKYFFEKKKGDSCKGDKSIWSKIGILEI